MSYGIGMSYKIDEKLSFNADYMYYYNKDSSTATGLALGIGFRF
jgi:outer membrane autotransporter protein